MKLHTNPWKHQKEALKYLLPRDFGALYTDMGSGKTKIMIDLIVNRGWERTIIVGPKKACRVWKGEVAKHAPNANLRIIELWDVAGKDKVNTLKKNSLKGQIGQEIVIINYESIWREPIRTFFLNKYKPTTIICDESHKIKSPSSKCSRFLTLLGKRVDYRYLMTGTPLAQSPLDIYAQYRFLQPEIFGTNFGNFKNKYANMVPMPGGFSILNKSDPYKNLDILQKKMYSCAFNVEVELNLPPTQDIVYEFDLSTKAQKYYKQIKAEGVLELKEGYLDTGNILAIITRLQQLTSGYLPITDEEGKVTITEIDDSRQVALKELLEDIPKEEPIVIFCKYKKDMKNVNAIVHALGRSSSEVSGRVDELDKWVGGETDVLVVQISSGAEGIDLTRARYNIYYTLTHSLAQYKQSRKRTHRPGQTRPVVYYKMVAKMKKGKTIDEQIVDSLNKNENIINSIMDILE